MIDYLEKINKKNFVEDTYTPDTIDYRDYSIRRLIIILIKAILIDCMKRSTNA